MENSSVFPIVTVGHVDHGKSTIVGHLLAKLGSLPDGKIENIRNLCEKQNRPFEYAFILDALREEQRQGITIDTARIFFKTELRSYQLLDAPGHVEFVKNMVTGASRAEAAMLIVDAAEGVKENSRRHAYLLSFLGIQQVIVLINKMDRVEYSQARFLEIQKELGEFLTKQNIQPRFTIPVSGLLGDNLVAASAHMTWWQGPTVTEALDSFLEPKNKNSLPLRTFIQDVYKFESSGSDRRILAGEISSGRLRAGDVVTIWPSREQSVVSTLEDFRGQTPAEFESKDSASFTLKQALFVTRGNLLTSASADITVGRTWRTDIFWLGKQSLQAGKSYILRHGSLKTLAVIEKIERVLNTSDLSGQDTVNEVKTNQAAVVTLTTSEPLCADLTHEQQDLTRFVLIDNYEISGGGKLAALSEATPTKNHWQFEKDLSGTAKLHATYEAHTLIIQVMDSAQTQSLGKVLKKYYQDLQVPVVSLSIEDFNVYDLPSLQHRTEGAQMAGAVVVIYMTDSRDESLRSLTQGLQQYEAVSLKASHDNEKSLAMIQAALSAKKLLLK